MEVEARLLPVPLHGPLREALHGGNLRDRKPAEVLEVHQVGQFLVDAGQFVERGAELGELDRKSVV